MLTSIITPTIGYNISISEYMVLLEADAFSKAQDSSFSPDALKPCVQVWSTIVGPSDVKIATNTTIPIMDMIKIRASTI